MGMAFSAAFVNKGLVAQNDILLVEPRLESHSQLDHQGFKWVKASISGDVSTTQLVILAVKPQDFPTVAIQLKPFLTTDQIVLSIMAGVTIQKIETLLGIPKIVRCMPNTPAKLGVGVTGFYNQGLNNAEEKTIQAMLESTGKALKLKEESMLNAVTAISGSGPAYFYYFLRAIVQAGKDLGMSEGMAKELASETMLGAYHLLQNSEASFDELIKAVTSKGGTTIAALETFDLHGVAESIQKGVIKAESRAWELSQDTGNS